MPGKMVHQCIGAGAGGVRAGFHAKDQQGAHYWIEVIGGILGGYTTSMFPDKLEPAISSWHRGPFHSAVVGGVVISLSEKLSEWGTVCRQKADAQRNVAQVENVQTGEWLPLPRTPVNEFIAQVAELFWRLLAGFLNGLSAGYVSHLVLDGVVGSRGIPLLFGHIALKG
jgi:hypothetical protein